MRYRLASATLAVVSLIGLTPGTSGARSVVLGALTGGGTIAPGLVTVPTYQSNVSFFGEFVGAATVDTVAAEGRLTCNFNGSSTVAETVAVGQGVMNGSCSGSGIGIVPGPAIGAAGLSQCATYFYSRVGAVMMLGYSQGAGCTASSFTGVAGTPQANYDEMFAVVVWTPGQLTPPVTSYWIAGVLQGVAVTS